MVSFLTTLYFKLSVTYCGIIIKLLIIIWGMNML